MPPFARDTTPKQRILEWPTGAGGHVGQDKVAIIKGHIYREEPVGAWGLEKDHQIRRRGGHEYFQVVNELNKAPMLCGWDNTAAETALEKEMDDNMERLAADSFDEESAHQATMSSKSRMGMMAMNLLLIVILFAVLVVGLSVWRGPKTPTTSQQSAPPVQVVPQKPIPANK